MVLPFLYVVYHSTQVEIMRNNSSSNDKERCDADKLKIRSRSVIKERHFFVLYMVLDRTHALSFKMFYIFF